jgi:hypothetical protein
MPQINPKSKLGLFLSTVVPGVVRPMHILWNEIIGFLFIVLAVPMVFGTVREFRSGDMKRTAILGCLAAVMLYYGVTSFLRARKISRS